MQRMTQNASNLQLDPHIGSKCNEAIVLSGAARSGTTILGQITQSFQGVEYEFEPPLFFRLFALMNELDDSAWKLLYETYMYEYILINGLAGRHLNLNQCDNSSVFRAKTKEEIEKRLSFSLRKKDASEMAKDHTISFKSPDLVPYLPKLKQYYPGTKIVATVRKAQDVIYSLLAKKWFTDESLQTGLLDWPYRIVNDVRIPFWVNPEDEQKWGEMDELHRVAHYYIRMNEPLDDIPDVIKISYDQLIEDPYGTAKGLAEQLGLSFGKKTDEVIASVKRIHYPEREKNILEELDPKIRSKVEFYSNQS